MLDKIMRGSRLLALFLVPVIGGAQGFSLTPTFTVTNVAPRPGKMENIAGACFGVKDDELLCNLTFVSLEYSDPSSAKSKSCTIGTHAVKPMSFKKTQVGAWQHTTEPDVLCGTVSTYTLTNDANIPLFWVLTIASRETDTTSDFCKNRKNTESIAKYARSTWPGRSCEKLEFRPFP